MTTYRDVLANREFRGIYASTVLMVAAGTMSNLALAKLVNIATNSAFLTALSLFASSIASLVGAATLMSAADRLWPRPTLSLLPIFAAGILSLQMVESQSVTSRIVLELIAGFVLSIGGGVRWGLLAEVLSDKQFVVGRSLMGLTFGLVQVAGFAAAGALLLFLSSLQIFAISGVMCLLASSVAWFGLTNRKCRGTERAGIRQTWAGNRFLLGNFARSRTYFSAWVPVGLIMGCEGIFYSVSLEGGPWLFAVSAAGLFMGDLTMGRLVPEVWRGRLVVPLLLLVAVPYTVMFISPPLPLIFVLVFVTGLSVSVTLPLQERLVKSCPAERRGQLLGLYSSGMTTSQAVGALLAGAFASVWGASAGMGFVAAVALIAVLAVAPAMSRDRRKHSESLEE